MSETNPTRYPLAWPRGWKRATEHLARDAARKYFNAT